MSKQELFWNHYEYYVLQRRIMEVPLTFQGKAIHRPIFLVHKFTELIVIHRRIMPRLPYAAACVNTHRHPVAVTSFGKGRFHHHPLLVQSNVQTFHF